MSKRESFGEHLHRRMEELGIDQRQLHAATGISQETISTWATDKELPSPEKCSVLAEYLPLDVDEVLDRAGYRPRVKTDSRPEVGEISTMLGLLPDEEIEYVRDFVFWRLSRQQAGIRRMLNTYLYRGRIVIAALE